MLRRGEPRGGMSDTKVENDAGPRLTRPREEAFFIAFNQPDGAVDHRDVSLPEDFRSLLHKPVEGRARHVDFGNHLAPVVGSSQAAIEFFMIAVEISSELMRVAPVTLAMSR